MKICIVSSGGGHLAEVRRLAFAYCGFELPKVVRISYTVEERSGADCKLLSAALG